MGFLIILYKKGTKLIPDIGTKNVTKKEYIEQTNKFMRPKMSGEGKGIRFKEDEWIDNNVNGKIWLNNKI